MKEKRKKKIKKEMEEKTKEKQVQKEIKIEDIKKRNKQDKNIQQNGWYVRYVTRPISLPLTKLFISFHPNTITIFMILIGLFSIPFFLNGGYLSIIIGAIILQIHLVFDSVDGNVARITNKRTWAGKYLDFLSNITV